MRLLLLLLSLIISCGFNLQADTIVEKKKLAGNEPEIVHSSIGDVSAGVEGKLQLRNIGKRQQYDWTDKSTLDADILSPKSANFHPDGSKFYVNSLEGCATVVYDARDLSKLKVITHKFPSRSLQLWAPACSHYQFQHYEEGESRAFAGKPVEAAFSHGGRFLWVPYYRRSFDINAQDPSAIAVIDTRCDSIVRMFDTGPLPKMVAVSPDNHYVAITHWGDNTVGLLDISDSDIRKWQHLAPLVAEKKLTLDFPLDTLVDRDVHSGLKLRGTVFTPDGRWLLVGAMGGALRVFDIADMKYVGQVGYAYNVRHLVIKGGMLFGTQCVGGTVISIPVDSLIRGVRLAISRSERNISAEGWRSCKVAPGARTLEATPDGKYIFVVCNSASEMLVVDAEAMTVADRIRVDSYPVGLALSPDGTRAVVTSQGRKGKGGHAVNIFEVLRPDYHAPQPAPIVEKTEPADDDTPAQQSSATSTEIPIMLIAGIGSAILAILIAGILIGRRR